MGSGVESRNWRRDGKWSLESGDRKKEDRKWSRK